MATFPGSQIASGQVGTFVLMPDGRTLNFATVAGYNLNAAAIDFKDTAGTTFYTYSAATELYAQKIKAGLDTIPLLPASFYVATVLIPTFAVFSLNVVTGTATGGTAVTVTGIGFVDGLVANLGGTVAAATFISANSFTFVTPPGTDGDIVVLTVRNPDETEFVFPNAFTYTP